MVMSIPHDDVLASLSGAARELGVTRATLEGVIFEAAPDYLRDAASEERPDDLVRRVNAGGLDAQLALLREVLGPDHTRLLLEDLAPDA